MSEARFHVRETNSREKIFRRKVTFTDSHTKLRNDVGGGARKERQRPRSRSLYTTHSCPSEDSGANSGKLEGSGWLSRQASRKNLYLEEYNLNDLWHDDATISDTTISPHGVIALRLRDRIRVDISLQRAIRVANLKSGIIMALNASGSSSAVIHPNGRVYQYGSRVEITTTDSQGNNKYAKMWYKGVSFTSDHCALVYLVDSAGTRTTTDTFSDLSGDFSLGVFYSDDQFPGESQISHLVSEAFNHVQAATYWVNDDGTDNWIINNVRVSQTTDGLVRVGRNSSKYSLRTSPSNGSASISSPFLHCTGSMGHTRHLFVRRGERRMHFDGSSFIVRNAGHSAGFDSKQQLKVY